METGVAVVILVLLLMLFLVCPVFWFIVFGIFGHPGWFIVAFVLWFISSNGD